MKAVDPQTPPTVQRTTFAGRVLLLRPTAPDLVDAAFVAVLCMTALAGFATTFDSLWFLVVAGIGVALGLLISHFVAALHWHWVVGLVAAVLVYFLCGGVVALRGNLASGFLPTLQTEQDLGLWAIQGWKSLLTTLPPVAGRGDFLVLPYLLGLFSSTGAYSLARTTRSPRLPLIIPTVLLAFVILMGSDEPEFLLYQGMAFALAALFWLILRTARRARLSGTGSARRARVYSSVALVVAAVAGGLVLGPTLPGTTDLLRVTLRPLVEPPVNVNQLPSPLAGFRKLASKQLGLFDQPLLQVEGAAPGELLRFAVLDSYDGLAWGASGGTGFRRVGSRLPVDDTDGLRTIRITIGTVYAAQSELNVWVPSIGPAASIAFEGDDAESHLQSLAYDLRKGQALVADRLRAGDVIVLEAVSVPEWVHGDSTPRSSGMSLVSDVRTAFLSDAIAALSDPASSGWDRLLEIATAFKQQGAWSDGTRGGEEQYLPGHGEGRLAAFFAREQIVGSDEQYAAAFALIANRLGFETRVVYGAKVGAGGVILGEDVTAWAEVQLGGTWVVLPGSMFIPDRDKRPEDTPPVQNNEEVAQPVPPPRPAPAPGDLQDEIGSQNSATGDTRDQVPATVLPLVLLYVGIGVGSVATLLGLLVGAKLWRRHRRFGRTDLVAKMHGAWQEVLDRARDMGFLVPGRATHREQAIAIGLPPVVAMAALTDQVMFGETPPGDASVAAFWRQADAANSALLQGERSALRRLWVRINPRSLFPMADAVVVGSGAGSRAGVTRPVATATPFAGAARALVEDFGAFSADVKAKRASNSAAGGR